MNLGANTDPAGLKDLFHGRVVNADFIEKDEILGVDLEIDLVFDASKKPWPIKDNEFGLTVLGDILEHMEEADIVTVLQETNRVSENVCITVPNDSRLGPGWNEDGSRLPEEERNYAPGSYHVTQVTEDKLRTWLENTGWEIDDWKTVHYHFVPEGYFITAHRKN